MFPPVVDCKQPAAQIESGNLISTNGTGRGDHARYMCGKHGLSTRIVEGNCDSEGQWIYPDCSQHVKGRHTMRSFNTSTYNLMLPSDLTDYQIKFGQIALELNHFETFSMSNIHPCN